MSIQVIFTQGMASCVSILKTLVRERVLVAADGAGLRDVHPSNTAVAAA
jgi:hypothetical protein